MDRRRFIRTGTRAAAALATLAALDPALAAPSSSAQSSANLSATPSSAASPAASPASVPSRTETVRVLAEGAPNSLDPHGDGFNRESMGAFANVYDRLLKFDRTELQQNAYRYDYHHLKGELAESFEPVHEGRSWRFHLREDARFHSGLPVSAEAVKWSLDRAVTLPASQRQLATGSMTDPAQFVVEGPHTLRIDLPRADRYALPNLALTFASIIDADTVRQNAVSTDPWGSEWLRNHSAGSGAYRVANWESGQRADYLRNDDWKSGRLPFVRRAIVQAVPESSNRIASLMKGDADIVLQLAPREFDTLVKKSGITTLSIPLSNTFRFIAFNTRVKPFDDVRVRQAIAYALPYNDLFNGVAKGHGTALFGAPPAGPVGAGWPQAYPYSTRLDRARALLGEAGYANGFKTSFTYNVADAAIAEPAALLVQQALAALSIDVSIGKAPGAQWGALQTEKRLPFFIDWSSAWFDDPDYFYRIFFEGDWRWNFASFDNAQLRALTDAARWQTIQSRYDESMRDAATIVIHDAPLLPLWSPSYDVAMRDDLRGFTYYIHGQVDFRTLRRT